MAAPLDKLMRPVKFVKGKAFIVITAGEKHFYVGPGTPPTVRELILPASEYGPIHEGVGSSSHGGINVLSGKFRGTVDGQFIDVSLIYTSTDAITWTLTHTTPIFSDDGSKSDTRGGALVWSSNAFRFAYTVQRYPDSGPTATEYEISSADGHIWSAPVATASGVDLESNGYRSPFPNKYCVHHNSLDMWKQHVPDGFMYQSAGLAIRPKSPAPMQYSNGRVAYTESGFIGSDKIETVTASALVTATAEFAVYCVAYAGSTLMAGGRGLEYSTDNGLSWIYVDYPSSAPVINIIPVGG